MRKPLIVLMTAALVIVPMQAAHAKTPFAVSAAPSATVLDYGGAVTVSGAVSPKAKKKKVYVQWLVGGAWRNVASTKTNSKSRYAVAFVPQLGAQNYRVFKGSSKKKKAGGSAWITITTSRWIALKDLPNTIVGSVTSTTATIKGYSYPSSFRIPSGGAAHSVSWNLNGRGCTKLDTHIGVAVGDGALADFVVFVNGVSTSSELQMYATDSARHYRLDAALSSLLFRTLTTPGTPFYTTVASPMVYCAS